MAEKVFAANIAGIYYNVDNDTFISTGPITLKIACQVSNHSEAEIKQIGLHVDSCNVLSRGQYFRPKFVESSIEVCRKIGKTLSDKKYSGPLDRYINEITGVSIKNPAGLIPGRAKTKPKYYYLNLWKIGIPRKQFAEEDVKSFEAALNILFGPQKPVVNDDGKAYFDQELRFCGTCKKPIEKYEIAHGLAHAHHNSAGSDKDPENLYRCCFDCNRIMLADHILHYQHKLDMERKKKALSNDPKSRLGDRVMRRIYELHKQLHDLGLEKEEIDTYSDPLIIYETLIAKQNLAVLTKRMIPDDYVVVSKKVISVKVKAQSDSKCSIM